MEARGVHELRFLSDMAGWQITNDTFVPAVCEVHSILAMRMEIPLTQRRYCWDTKMVTELAADLQRAALEGKSKDYFMGMVSYLDVNGPSKISHFLYDGQQRMTSFALICLALVRKLAMDPAHAENAREFGKFLQTKKGISLTLGPDDRVEYAELINNILVVGEQRSPSRPCLR